MDKKQYIMIGTKTLSKDIFRNVLRPLDNQTFKPSGGLWASDYSPYIISPWFDFLRNNPDYLYYKNIYAASRFTLNDDANILTIDNSSTLKETLKKYPSYSHLLNNHQISEESINYELLSKDYDGLYLDANRLFIYEYSPIFRPWKINTLLLFNLDVMENYESITIDFYSEENYNYPYFKEIINKAIEEESSYHRELYNYIELVFNELIYKKENYIDYDDFFSYLSQATKECINITLKNKKDSATSIKLYLQNQSINTDEYTIIRNIATSILSNYFKSNVDTEKSIPKTKTKKLLTYTIDEKEN